MACSSFPLWSHHLIFIPSKVREIAADRLRPLSPRLRKLLSIVVEKIEKALERVPAATEEKAIEGEKEVDLTVLIATALQIAVGVVPHTLIILKRTPNISMLPLMLKA
mmetsp:Transcript_26526/g.36531  ORF Transcript_26526/g.36531 Transcript_26526/m.36531 type:complete len:108 (+) Transcript_26526:1339-1662(+)